MKSSSRWVITGLACIALVAVLAAYKVFQIRAMIEYGKSFPEHSESVEAVTTSVRTFEETVTTLGEIIAPQSLELRNEVEGLVTAVNFASGDRVNKGDVLVQLDVSEEQARLRAAQARVKLAGLELDRVKRLIRQKTVSEESVDKAEANDAIARADVKALQASIAKKTLRAPFDAVAGIHTLEVGEYLQANTPIVTLLGLNDYSWVDFNLPLANADVELGSQVWVQLPEGEQRLPATIIARNPVASTTSRMVKLRARIDGILELPPHAIVRVVVPIGSSDQIMLPRTALRLDSMGDYVYILKPDDSGEGYRAERRQLTLGYRDDELVGVVSGLKEGELVAARGAYKLLPNMLTYVRERPGAAADAAE